MGNIRTSFVKRLANKKLVMEYSTVSTKHLRNKIAGYVTRLVRLEQTQE